MGLNVLLAALWLAGRGLKPPQQVDTVDISLSTPDIQTNVVVRKQFFSWGELESANYSQYIENLRSINCPEQTIRDIIIADVNQLFTKRRSTEAIPTTRQWWQNEADPAQLRQARRQIAALEMERRALLSELLGPDWDHSAASGPTVAIRVPLDGPLLGALSGEAEEAVQTISGKIQREYEAILKSSGGQPSPAALAGLDQQLIRELTPLLSSAQMEEFMFRYSQSARRLRSDLANLPLFNPTPMESRTVFRNAQQVELQLMGLTGDDPATDAERKILENERRIAFQNALGPARYKEFERLQDPIYQQAIEAAQAAGIASATDLFYLIDRLGSQDEERIKQDTSLTPLQQELALRKLQVEQLQVAAEALGQAPSSEPPPPPRKSYAFQKGDTIAKVSMETGVPVALILRANPNLQPERIPPGTQIIIPEWTAPFP